MREKRKPLFKSKPKYAIVLEGQCEFWYLDMLKRNEPTIGFDLSPKIPAKKKLEDQYKRVVDFAQNEFYDKVFWIIDCDVIAGETRLVKKGKETPQQQLDKFIKKLAQDYEERVVIIKNNPCIEYWLLLHFEETTAQFTNCEAAGKRLKKYLDGYEKHQRFYIQQNDIYLQLKPHLAKALKHAEKSEKLAANNAHATISQMHFLFNELGLGKK